MRFLPYILALVVAVSAMGCVTAVAVAQKTQKKYEVVHTREEWHKILSPEAYNVLRNSGTEEAFTGKLLDVHDKGVFVCAGCGQKLFRSETKFDSGTGWPSFWQPITAKAIEKVEDLSDGMTRTEVKCSRCGGHLGHVFDDGPAPTGLRFCMNSVAMKFVPDPKK
jgi:peptide-methionine (R)-S-oxide reductase